MGFDDRATVATIGGGHAFGKCHGACLKEEFDKETGMCPGGDTWEYKFTSGLELDWTTIPTTWSNQYFTNLFEFNWTNTTSPAGAIQWKPVSDDAPNIGMLTTDLALYFGDPEYEKLSREYAADIKSLEKDFGEGWYQLMARDVGPRERCLGDELPPMQAWETSLGPRTSPLPDFIPVRFCAWLAQLPETRPLKTSLCEPGAAAYDICRETCGRCEEGGDDSPVASPVDSPTEPPTVEPDDADPPTDNDPPTGPPETEEPVGDPPVASPTEAPTAEPDDADPPTDNDPPTDPAATEEPVGDPPVQSPTEPPMAITDPPTDPPEIHQSPQSHQQIHQ